MDSHFSDCCITLLFFPKKICKTARFLYTFLARSDERNESVPLFAAFTAKCFILFANDCDDFTCSCFTSTFLENEGACRGTNCVYRRYFCNDGSTIRMIRPLFDEHKKKMLQLAESYQVSHSPYHNWQRTNCTSPQKRISIK